MTSHRVDQPFASLCAGIVTVAFTAWVLHGALKTGRVNTGRGRARYVYRDVDRGKFWTYLFFIMLALVTGAVAMFISVEDFLR